MDDDVQTAKRRMREALRSRVRALDPDYVTAAGAAMAAHLVEALPPRGRVGLFAALRDEIPTRPLFEALRERGRSVLLPRAERERLAFSIVDTWSVLTAGAHGLLEPPAGSSEVAPAEADWFVIPGLAFDRSGQRLGRGAGFYDRAFAGSPPRAPTRVGAAFSVQVVASVPHDSRDRPVDAIVTENGFCRVGECR